MHVSDAVRLYRLALEKGQAGARYNAVGEEGVALRDIAEVIGAGWKVPVESITPEEAPEYFGWVKADVFKRMFDAVADEPDMKYAMVDATIVKM